MGATHVGLSVVLKFRHTKWSDLLQVKIKMFLSVHLSNRCILIKFKVKHQGQVHENSEIVFDGNSTSDYPIRVTAINLAVAIAVSVIITPFFHIEYDRTDTRSTVVIIDVWQYICTIRNIQTMKLFISDLHSRSRSVVEYIFCDVCSFSCFLLPLRVFYIYFINI